MDTVEEKEEAAGGGGGGGGEWWVDEEESSGSEVSSDELDFVDHSMKEKSQKTYQDFVDSTRDSQTMTVHVHINGIYKIPIFCGDGTQSLKWLCMAAVQRYRASLESSGRLRHCEPLSQRSSFRAENLIHHTGGLSGAQSILNDYIKPRFRAMKGNFIPQNLRLKASLNKVAHHVNKMRQATLIRSKATAAFFRSADKETAHIAIEAMNRASKETAATRSRASGTGTTLSGNAPALVGLNPCSELKRRGRAGSGNRVPNAQDQLVMHLKNGDHVFLELDEAGGAYVRRDTCFSVSTFMRLRFVESRKGAIDFELADVIEDLETIDEGYNIYVRERGLRDRNSKQQISKNLSYMALFKFISDKDDQDALRKIFKNEDTYDQIRTLFRQYAYSGAGDAFTMDVGEWESLCKDAGVLGPKGMTFGAVDTIFIAANYTAKAAKKDAKISGRVANKQHESFLGNPDNAFTLFEFIEAICRLGVAMKFETSEKPTWSPSEKIKALLDQHILPLAKKCEEEWNVFQEIEDKAVQNCFHRRMQDLELKFLKFCPHMSTKKKSILNMHLNLQNYIDLIESTGLLREDDVTVSVSVTHRTIRECFIWSQRKTTEDKASIRSEEDSLTEMGFYEFLESLALMAHRIFAEHPEWTGGRNTNAEHLSEQLDALIDLLVAPRENETHYKHKK